MKYSCPLCGQPVSPSLYQKITGIWKERQRLLEEVRRQREKLKRKLQVEKERLAKELITEREKFVKQKAVLIERAVSAKTRQFEKQIAALKRRGERIENLANAKIKRMTEQANAHAMKLAKSQFSAFKKKLRASVKAQLRKEREQGAQLEQRRYESLQKTFRTTLQQMKTLKRDLRIRDERIRELEKQLKKQTTPQLEGLLYEETLAKELRKLFPEDFIQHTGKGGDVLQNVMKGKQQVGLIVYECKRVKHYSPQHVKQAAEAKKKRNADFAVLVTNAMRKGTQGFFVEKGVIVVHATGVVSISGILRSHIVQIAGMKLGQLQKEKAVRLILDYLEGPEFTNSIELIIQESISICEELMDEIKKHTNIWKKRYLSYKKIHEEATIVKNTTKDLLSGETKPKNQKAAFPVSVRLPMARELEQKIPIEVTAPLRKKKPIGVAFAAARDESVRKL